MSHGHIPPHLHDRMKLWMPATNKQEEPNSADVTKTLNSTPRITNKDPLATCYEDNTAQQARGGTVKTSAPGPMWALLSALPVMLSGKIISGDKSGWECSPKVSLGNMSTQCQGPSCFLACRTGENHYPLLFFFPFPSPSPSSFQAYRFCLLGLTPICAPETQGKTLSSSGWDSSKPSPLFPTSSTLHVCMVSRASQRLASVHLPSHSILQGWGGKSPKLLKRDR